MLQAIKNIRAIRHWRYGRCYGSQYADIAMFRAVDGWLTDSEANRLFDLASQLPDQAPILVELGSWVGKSSVVLSHAVKNKPGAKLYCVDPFNAAGEAASVDDYKSRQEKFASHLHGVFQNNMANYGAPSLVESIQAYSFDAAKDWDQKIDFIFIDASHDYEDVKKDIEDWAPFIKPGGIIAFHDVNLVKTSLELSGPGQAAKELIADTGEWDEMRLVHSVFSARRKK